MTLTSTQVRTIQAIVNLFETGACQTWSHTIRRSTRTSNCTTRSEGLPATGVASAALVTQLAAEV